MVRWCFGVCAVALSLGVGGCQPVSTGGHGHSHGPGGHHGAGHHGGGHGDHGHDHGPDPISLTTFTDKTELFVEFPPLAVGERSRFAAHITTLADFRPVLAGRVVVELSKESNGQRFEVIKPAEPGIFRPVIIPTQTGKHSLKLTLESESGQRDTHDLGVFEVHPDKKSAEEAGGSAAREGAIALLKEQQWTLDFSTEAVKDGSVRPTYMVYGTVQARQGEELAIKAPSSGRVADLDEGIQRGMKVTEGQVLIRLSPLPQAGSDTPALQAAMRQAQLNLGYARRERERQEALFEQGAIPKRRLDEARHKEGLARVALGEASQRLRLNRRSAGARGESIEVRSPVEGVLVSLDVAPGQSVAQGAPLFKVLDSASLWLEARIPESDLGRSAAPFSGWAEAAQGERFELVPEQARGTIGPVDRLTRTAPLRFKVGSQVKGLYLGASVKIHLHTGPPVPGPVVPREAIVREGAQEVVFVQLSGEAFERRPVRLGAHDTRHVHIREGLAAGERVVVKGAYLVKLAASSNQVPDHGHVH